MLPLIGRVSPSRHAVSSPPSMTSALSALRSSCARPAVVSPSALVFSGMAWSVRGRCNVKSSRRLLATFSHEPVTLLYVIRLLRALNEEADSGVTSLELLTDLALVAACNVAPTLPTPPTPPTFPTPAMPPKVMLPVVASSSDPEPLLPPQLDRRSDSELSDSRTNPGVLLSSARSADFPTIPAGAEDELGTPTGWSTASGADSSTEKCQNGRYSNVPALSARSSSSKCPIGAARSLIPLATTDSAFCNLPLAASMLAHSRYIGANDSPICCVFSALIASNASS